MPKDETSTFFNDPAKPQGSTGNPDNMSKWISVAEKGLSLIENLMAMKKAKEGGATKGGGETSAYEKGLAQGQAMHPPVIQTKAVKVDYKVDEAVEYLWGALGKIDRKKTIGEVIDGELSQAKESGIMSMMMKKFLEEFVEVSQ